LSPHILCHYLLDLTSTFNVFYQNCRVIDEKEKASDSRIALVESTSIVLKKGLNLLGIQVLDNM